MPDRVTVNVGVQKRSWESILPVPWTLVAAVIVLPLASCGNATRETEASATDSVRVAAADEEAQPATEPAEATAQNDHFHVLIRHLESGIEWLRQQDSYSAEVMLQERVDGELQEPHVVELVCRHDPFSAYMKWTQGPTGRELIYVAGQNRDKVLVHPEGFRGRIVSRIALEQDSPLIMSERRYQISEFGLLKLNERLLSILKGYSAADIDVDCASRIAEGSARPAAEFDLELPNRQVDDTYRRVIVLLDAEHSIAVSLTSYTWPETPEGNLDDTLIESYDYRSIEFGSSVTDATFDPANPEYHFTR